MKFNPEITTGTIIQTLVFLGGLAVSYGAYREDQTKQDGRISQIEVVAAKDREATKEALKEIKQRLDKGQSDTQDIKESLAVLSGQSLGSRGRR